MLGFCLGFRMGSAGNPEYSRWESGEQTDPWPGTRSQGHMSSMYVTGDSEGIWEGLALGKSFHGWQSYWTGDWISVLCIGLRILNHWTTSEVPHQFLRINTLSVTWFIAILNVVYMLAKNRAVWLITRWFLCADCDPDHQTSSVTCLASYPLTQTTLPLPRYTPLIPEQIMIFI